VSALTAFVHAGTIQVIAAASLVPAEATQLLPASGTAAVLHWLEEDQLLLSTAVLFRTHE
jgi:hypothetical protein